MIQHSNLSFKIPTSGKAPWPTQMSQRSRMVSQRYVHFLSLVVAMVA
jgi:hypothetical protein